MKRILSLLLSFILIISFSSCTPDEQKTPISLTKENFSDYIFLDYYFSELMIDEYSSSSIGYYTQCTLTIKIKPLRDYDFNGASVEVSYSAEQTQGWRMVGENTLSGRKTVRLDKDGYGEAVINLFAYGFDNYIHPAELDWSISITDAN